MVGTAPPLRDHPLSSPRGTTAHPYYVSGVSFGLPRGRTVNLFAKSARTTGVTSLYSVPARIGPAVRRFGPSSLRLVAGVTVVWFFGREVGGAPFEERVPAVNRQG